MSVYRRGKHWHYQFKFAGRHYRESAKTTSQKIARAAELKRRREVEEAYNGVTTERPTPKLFSVAGAEWLKLKESTLAKKSYAIEKCNMAHLKAYFGQKLLQDITAELIARYVGHRRAAKAADKTIKLELGTL